MSNVKLSNHLDRCCNPYDREGHKGKALRVLSKNLKRKFPDILENSKICYDCRNYKIACTDDSEIMECNTDETVDSMDTSSSSSVNHDSSKDRSQREIELEEMLDELKKKFSSLSLNDPQRLVILTIVPTSWSIKKIAREFRCSERLAKRAKQLKAAKGILGDTTAKGGKKLSETTVEKINEFYQTDSNSRVMPGVKDVKSVKIDGKRVLMQKRLLLLDLNGLYSKYKELHPDFPVSFSKFAQMRPQHCVLMGSSGTHTVCVCTIHQNCKLMFDAIDFESLTKESENPVINYKSGLSQIMCKNATIACNLDECKNCPGNTELCNYLKQCLPDNNIFQVIFSQWTGTDRCTLNTHIMSSEDFVDVLCSNLLVLKSHSFIAKKQADYFENIKTQLLDKQVLVTLDFAENYKYVAQDAVQAFHFNNDQCTVFTVVCYFKGESKIEHKSFIFLSDCTQHDTSAVYTVQRLLIPELKKLLQVEKIIYFSDGAKQHFKNRYQIKNLMNHEKDFGITAEWHYHATAHGKNACDGIGATFKREAARASLFVKSVDAILTAARLYDWSKQFFDTMSILFYSKVEHAKVKRSLKARFDSAPPVPQIQKSHSFTVLHENTLFIKRFSSCADGITFRY